MTRGAVLALVLAALVVGYVVWQRPEAPAPKPVPPKEVVLQYADGSTMWRSTGAWKQPPIVQRVFAELGTAALSFDSLRGTGGVVRTTIDARAQTFAAAVVGRLIPPLRVIDTSAPTRGRPRELDASVTAIDPGSGRVRVYLPGLSSGDDLAGGVRKELPAALAEPLATAAAPNAIEERATPLNVSAAYATLAARGVQREPHFVTSVTAANGSLLYEAADTTKPAFATDRVDRITASLKEKPGCDGTACVPGAFPWMVGYTPKLAVTVYVEQAGAVDAGLPMLIWQEFLKELPA
ncbi:hypothetical protein [Lentzea nigeriaca]|uniref:hypothetical protein n=1 Tax=Lentzea nigeriaca TaxID=1128665 RepID=UPI00195B64FF|nr:hypothetical protein [Lentzea nigeriaca]MBM7858182.1 membrane peptidoglycan carboxypeptidase [Lentzea nigeriaca]